MYTITEFMKSLPWTKPVDTWEGKIACTEGSIRMESRLYSFDSLKVYGFLLVRRGSMLVRYRGRDILFREGEIQAYVPYMPVATLEYSSDFDGIALFFDTDIMEQSPMYHRLFRDAYNPLQSLREPKITLGDAAAQRLGEMMHLIHLYIAHPSDKRRDMLYSLCGVFLFDLLEEQGISIESSATPNHADELLQRFLTLVNEHYAEQHDLPFYAEQLCITTTYLSRLVRQMFGCTAKDIINRALLAESEYQLRTTQQNIAQIADNLHFADQSSFNHFFTRLKGLSPTAFRRSVIKNK